MNGTARERRKPREETLQFATFHVERLFFGIEAVRVQEVLRYQEMTPIPLAPQAMKGLINLRGQIVAAVDTRCTLGIPPHDGPEKPMNIIIQTDDGPVSLLVDSIGDVLEVPLNSYAPAPDNVPAHQRELIAGVYRLKDRLMLLLRAERFLEISCR
jgi:purine-binding chemotaxis protein CheW